jgi:hypothetical protein
MRRGWHYKYACTAHLELGPAFAFVSPQQIFVQLSNPEAITQVVTNRHQFPRPAKNYGELFLQNNGPCVADSIQRYWLSSVRISLPQHQKIGRDIERSWHPHS